MLGAWRWLGGRFEEGGDSGVLGHGAEVKAGGVGGTRIVLVTEVCWCIEFVCIVVWLLMVDRDLGCDGPAAVGWFRVQTCSIGASLFEA